MFDQSPDCFVLPFPQLPVNNKNIILFILCFPGKYQIMARIQAVHLRGLINEYFYFLV